MSDNQPPLTLHLEDGVVRYTHGSHTAEFPVSGAVARDLRIAVSDAMGAAVTATRRSSTS